MWHICPGCAWLQEFYLSISDASKKEAFQKKKYLKKRHQELDKLAQLTALVLFSLLWSDHVDLRQPESDQYAKKWHKENKVPNEN
jgi:hypothetical protein